MKENMTFLHSKPTSIKHNMYIYFFRYLQWIFILFKKCILFIWWKKVGGEITDGTKTPTEKYEDKYMEAFKKIKNMYFFTEEETQVKKSKIEEYKAVQKEDGDDEAAEKWATEYVWNQRCERLKNNYILEYTPLGNVIMYYDQFKSSFIYYSDHTLPYRFLEVVARKYVITFKCPKLFVLMEDSVKEAEEKLLLKEKEEQQQKQQQEQQPIVQKKNVFAKFKNYNKPQQETISANTIQKQTHSQTHKLLLKENANRYTHGGRFLDFNMLQKIDKKLNDQRLSISFSDYKKKYSKK